jgi:hypothetical protein
MLGSGSRLFSSTNLLSSSNEASSLSSEVTLLETFAFTLSIPKGSSSKILDKILSLFSIRLLVSFFFF